MEELSLEHRGYADALSYNLEWDKGTDDWEEISGGSSDSLVLTHIITDGITEGGSYNFRYRVKNVFGFPDEVDGGWSIYSDDTKITAISIPDQMSAPTTANSGTDVVITWPEPNSNGADITEYLIEVQTNDGDFVEEDTFCDGAANVVREGRTCSIPMSVLTDVPYSLTQGITIKARVSSINAQGFSNP